MSRGASRKRDSLRTLNQREVEPTWFDLERLRDKDARPVGDGDGVRNEQVDERQLDDPDVDRVDRP